MVYPPHYDSLYCVLYIIVMSRVEDKADDIVNGVMTILRASITYIFSLYDYICMESYMNI